MAKFNIINKAERVVNYILTITNKSPKKLRCDIIPELRKTGCRILEDIVRANCTDLASKPEVRLNYQQDCIASIRFLEALSEICEKKSYITSAQLMILSKQTQELYDMIKRWIESDSKR